MLSVHDRTTTDFTTSGLAVLDPAIIGPEVHEQIGGQYLLQFSYPANAPAAQHLQPENIIASPTPTSATRQGFRICQITHTVDDLLDVTAFHVFYDLSANLIPDTFVVNKTAGQALTQILGAAMVTHPFTATSADTTTIASARIVRQPVTAVLLDTSLDNSFVTRWGGELSRDNYRIHHAPRLGADRGVVIRHRKNLAGFEAHLDHTSVITRLIPIGFDGLLLPETFIDSPRIGDYLTPRVGIIRFDQVKAITDPAHPRDGELPLDQAHAKLRQLAAAQFATSHIDQPTATYRINMVDLASTREYADLARLETVTLGDTVTVRHHTTTVTARVMGYTFDPLTGSYISLQLGQAAAAFTSITHQIQAATDTAHQATETAGQALICADGKNTNHYGPTQPAHAALGDTWFKTNGESIEIWGYQLTDSGEPGWVAVATDLNHAQVSAELEAARAEVAAAQRAVANVETLTGTIKEQVQAATTGIDQARQVADEAHAEAVKTATRVDGFAVTVNNLSTNVSSSVTALTNNINLRVTKDQVITQINLSPETILIDGKRIHLTGATTIDDATIKTAMIADASITNAKIAALDAAKINTGTLNAARIAAGSITSDKLMIANGYISTAMIADAAITNAKIAALDAGKITTGYLNAARIAAGTITADKLAANAIQVGLAGWNQSIRITPYDISWYNGAELAGKISSTGMDFYAGTRHIGVMGETVKGGNTAICGISMNLDRGGNFITWGYRTSDNVAYTSMLTLDPAGTYQGPAGIHLGAELRLHGYNLHTPGNRPVQLVDTALANAGTFPGWTGSSGLSKVVFHTYDLMVVTNGTYYNMTRLFERTNDLMSRVNEIIRRLNYGWIVSITGSGSNIQWTNYSNTGLQTMSTALS